MVLVVRFGFKSSYLTFAVFQSRGYITSEKGRSICGISFFEPEFCFGGAPNSKSASAFEDPVLLLERRQDVMTLA